MVDISFIFVYVFVYVYYHYYHSLSFKYKGSRPQIDGLDLPDDGAGCGYQVLRMHRLSDRAGPGLHRRHEAK